MRDLRLSDLFHVRALGERERLAAMHLRSPKIFSIIRALSLSEFLLAMIFYRRVVQAELHRLRKHLDGYVVDRLVRRLNAPDRDRLAAMWEVVVLSALCELGEVVVEAPTRAGRRPDVLFNGSPNFIADITSISDQGLEDRNPVDELSVEIERGKAALGLPVGGLDLRIGSYRRRLGTGQQVDLRIPHRRDIPEFVQRRIIPEIKLRMDAGELPMRIEIKDDEAELTVLIDPSKGPFNSGGYASYNVSEAIDRNPLANALERKAEQLLDAEGLRGIFVCDTGSASIQDRRFSTYGYSPKDIIRHFLRCHSHIDFVVTLAVWERQFGTLDARERERRVDVTLYARQGVECEAELKSLVDALVRRFPKPRATGENGRRQAGDIIYRWGFHGGHSMTGRSVKISVREIAELLAGKCTVEDLNQRHQWNERDGRHIPNPFERLLNQGRLPIGVTIESGAPADDDWIEFSFGEPDPAISKFR
ncbi:hypothetical protein [Sinorhizobium meliloti]|uniref:hypothetical protein n=1 Tax=Rhizobium meliloti TaxID=382 RepID=UPI000FD9854F|nr:hypothetical protein [Sinorhizobium meliloti]MDW9620160.1 hypothetical protein [Sinorhizobium meliloti]RVG42869.1 hypothetical protein CN226_33855 [Sinorhizobium meliloti]RVL49896.1 hypothetical protein CN141_31655 [Sinorhizobium meliloti]